LEIYRKDVSLACELGRQVNVLMEMASIVEQRFIEAMNRGWGRMNANVALD
jgi:3-hydroxyisobutyrate dehydrogenase-like beta-hydroxyacid dehydrogenase